MTKKIITTEFHLKQINLVLGYIHSNFITNINANDLAKIGGYSIFHFHRIFKEIVGQNIDEYIRNTRLEKTSNLLIYNQHKTIEQIAIDSGFSTATGFTNAFKKKFGMTPKEWRKGGYESNTSKQITMITIDENMKIHSPQIVKEKNISMMYMRIFGYEKNISDIWNKMYEWADEFNISKKIQRHIGLFHNHPSFYPYNKARYLACIQTEENIFGNGNLGKCTISEGRFAKFNFKCTHSELYKMMHLAYIEWLPTSNYEVRNFPAYVEYNNPENLLTNDVLECDFFMPIQLINK